MEEENITSVNEKLTSFDGDKVFSAKDVSVSYGDFVAIKNVNMDITKNKLQLLLDLQVVEKVH